MADETEHTIKTAAEALGTSEGAVRQRIRRGTLRSVRREGRVYVVLDGTEPSNTVESTTLTSETSEENSESFAAVEALRDEVEWLRGEVQRKDAILLNMTEAMKALSPPASPAPREEPPESPETAAEDVGSGDVPPRRSWWRRMFGG
jgi:hypothetical protein